MHQVRLTLPLHLQSFGGINRVWPFGELRIPLLHAFPAPSSHLPHHSKYDTQMTQILLEEYIFIPVQATVTTISVQWCKLCALLAKPRTEPLDGYVSMKLEKPP